MEATLAENRTSPYKPGDILEGGKYRLERLLGFGSYAEVWLATDTADNSMVAIKIRRWQLTAESIKRRFLGEMQIARRLGKCEYIVTALVYLNREGQDGYSGIVQEFIDGGSLRDRMNEGAPSEQEALRIISQILKALIVVHKAGVIHRDLKPENVLMNASTSPATAMITDFGVAHASGGDGRMTQMGHIMGTPQYTAPEQAASATLATHRSDLFSVGVMLAELVGVDPIVQSNDMSGVGQVNNPVILRAWWDRITNPGIRGIVEQATAVEYDYLEGTVTARRFASAEIMLSAVEAAREGASQDEPAWTPYPSQEPETAREGGTAVPPGTSNLAPWRTHVASKLDDADADPSPDTATLPPRKWGRWIDGGLAIGAVILVVIFLAWLKDGKETVEAPPVVETHVNAPVAPPPDPIPTPVETPTVTPVPIVADPPRPNVPAKVEAPKPPIDPKPKAKERVTSPPPVAAPTVTEPKITITSPQAEVKVGEVIAIKVKVVLPPGSTVNRASLYWQGANGGAWQSKTVTVNGGTIETSIPASAGLGASVQYYVAAWIGDVRKNGDKVTTNIVP